MFATLIPLFDGEMSVRAYSLFTQKQNFLLNPSLQGTGSNDGAAQVVGLEVIENMGLESVSTDKEVFVAVNNISIFSDALIKSTLPHERLILLTDNSIGPEEIYINKLRCLKEIGYKLAIRKLPVQSFEKYREILQMMDYILLDHKKVDISKAQIYFRKLYPNIKLCVVNIQTQETFEKLSRNGDYQFYEGEFYRTPVTKGDTKVAPLKVNYIELLNTVNSEDFELTEAADIIGRDTALVISLLKMVNKMAVNSEITSIRHAAVMLGQRELKRWINTAVVSELYADRPNEITRLSLLRAKFVENLAPLFGLGTKGKELFLMGLFSVLDLIMEKPMEEALKIVKVSKEISDALVSREGVFAPILEFALSYENADWQEVSRLMIVKDIDMDPVYDAYVQSLGWYRDLLSA